MTTKVIRKPVPYPAPIGDALKETFAIELPRWVLLAGARKDTAWADISKWTVDFFIEQVKQGVKIRAQRKSAGQGDDHENATAAEWNRLVDLVLGTATVSGKSGPRMTLEERAERAVLVRLFIGQGFDKTAAAKRAKMPDPLKNFILTALSKGRTEPVPDGDIVVAMDKFRPSFDQKVADEVVALRAEDARNKGIDATDELAELGIIGTEETEKETEKAA